MPVSEEASLARVVGLLRSHNPDLARLLAVSTETEFVQAVEALLERAIRTIEGGAKRYGGLDERGLSGLLADFLSLAGCDATAEREHNGHVDVTVEHKFDKRWKYLGECKIHRGYQYHVDGCEQLLGYCSGREERAFSLDFVKRAGMYTKMKGLRDEFDTQRPLRQADASTDHPIGGAFLTSHAHAAGSKVEILHIGCSVHSAPSDADDE